ncbi:MAG: hypothetical protein ACYC7A_13025 [Thermoanaerobaculia bacterium]
MDKVDDFMVTTPRFSFPLPSTHYVYEQPLDLGQHLNFSFYTAWSKPYVELPWRNFTIRLYKDDKLHLEYSGAMNGWDNFTIYLAGGQFEAAGIIHREGCYVAPYQGDIRCATTSSQPVPFKKEVPLRVEFDATNTKYPDGLRMLVARHGVADPYPHPEVQIGPEGGRPRMRLSGKVVDPATGTAPTEPTPVYFRLRDPKDSAKYVSQAGQAIDGDNFDQDASLSSNGAGAVPPSDSCLGSCPPLRVDVTPPDGSFELILTGAAHAAGDNYRIEASLSPDMTCSESVSCARTPIITTWKRIYVEVNRMFRRGTYLRTTAEAGDSELEVVDADTLPQPPFYAIVIHGPSYTSQNRHYWYEEVRVDARDGNRLSLESSLIWQYGGEELVDNLDRPYLADAIGVVSGVATEDFYVADLRGVNAAFAEAFVEHVFLTRRDNSLELADEQRVIDFEDGIVPHDRIVGRRPARREPFALYLRHHDLLTRKWLKSASGTGSRPVALANHQAFFSCAQLHDGATVTMGLTSVASGWNDTWFPTETAPAAQEAEAVVHELAHQWRVNPEPMEASGHCNLALNAVQQAFGTNLQCTMTFGTDGLNNSHVGFHYVEYPAGSNQFDSEYLRIRQRTEPVPQTQPLEREP